MGMFDWVNVRMDCPKCGKLLDTFQSKDLYCAMEKIDPDYFQTFYTSCDYCKSWISFSRPQEACVINKPRPTPFSRQEVETMGFVLNQED